MARRPMATGDLDTLKALRSRFGDGAAGKKAAALGRLSLRPIDDPRVMLDYHELLLFMAAYPDSASIAALVAGLWAARSIVA